MEILTAAAIFLAFLAFLEALHSFVGGLSFARMTRRAESAVPGGFSPPAVLILPCRGVDPGLEANLRAYLSQEYPDWRLLLVTDDPKDASVAVIRSVLAEFPGVSARLLFAGPTRRRGQKVHNLLHALEFLRPGDEVLAFGDSDIRPGPNWLRDLVAVLEGHPSGLATGFRWYLPRRGNWASVLRAVWNAGAVSLMRERDNPFAWGGAMAIRRRTFLECGVADRWQNALSDDLAMSRAVRAGGGSILFQPRAISFTHEDCGWGEFFKWSRRQMTILRVYLPRLWWLSLLAQSVNALALWGGLAALATVARPQAAASSTLASLLLGVYLLGCGKALLRLRAVVRLYPNHAAALRRHLWAYVFATPLASLASLAALLASAASREIEWRGIRYRLRSADETEVVG